MSENKIFTGKSILLVSLAFFSYEAAIKNKLVDLGADVTYVDDRPSNNFLAKGIIRVYKKLLDDPILKYYAQVTSDIADREFDIVFLLNPERMFGKYSFVLTNPRESPLALLKKRMRVPSFVPRQFSGVFIRGFPPNKKTTRQRLTFGRVPRQKR